MYFIGIALTALGGIGTLACFIMVLIKMFQNEKPLLGVLGILCGLWTFVWGWMKSKQLGLKNVMLGWTASMVILFIGEGIMAAGIAANIQQGIKDGTIKVQTTP